MQCKTKSFLLSLLIVAASATVVTSSIAENLGDVDPPRWTHEDMTPQARYQTSKKEADAAYRAAVAECKAMSRADRNSCMREARDNHQADLSEAKRRLSE